MTDGGDGVGDGDSIDVGGIDGDGVGGHSTGDDSDGVGVGVGDVGGGKMSMLTPYQTLRSFPFFSHFPPTKSVPLHMVQTGQSTWCVYMWIGWV